MRKSFKAVLSVAFCMMLVSVTMLVSLAVGNISNLKATNVTHNSATITWTAASDADGYELSYTTGSTTKKVTIKGKSTTSYKLALTTGKSYTVKVKSYDKPLIGKTKYGKEYSVTVKAVPAKVTNFKATNLSGGKSVKLSWTKVSGATGYVVQQYKGGKWTNIKTTTGSYYNVTGLTAGTEYKFRIAAYVKYSGKNYYGSYVSLTAKPTFLASSTQKVNKVTATSAYFYWSGVTGAKNYQVYNYNTKKYSYTTSKGLTLSGLTAGTEYKVRVRGYAKIGGKNVYGAWSSYFTFTTVPAKLAAVNADNITKTSVDVSWDKAPGASGYQVYLYNYVTKENKRVKVTTATNYTIEGLEAGSTYRIGIRSYVKNSGTYYYSSYSYAYVDTLPVIETGEGTNATDIVLQWTKVRKATLYTVERYTPNKYDWTLIAEIPVEPYTSNIQSAERITYTDAGVGENKGEIYRIKAYNGEALISESEFEATTAGISLEKNDFSVTVSWNAPADVSKYTVYKMPITSGNSHNLFAYDFEIEDASAESFTFNLAPNDIHTYMIFATGSNGSGGAVATFSVKTGPLVIDSTDASKTAQLLMLVNAINKSKLYQGDVDVTVDTYAKMVLDAIYFSEKMLDEIPAIGLIADKNGEIAGDKVVDFFQVLVNLGLATEADIPETVTIEDPAAIKYSFSEGYGKNEKGYTIALKTLIEPSGTADKLAYLYNEHDVKTWKDGFSSVKTTYYPETGKYKIVATLKQEKFGTTTNQPDAKYHHGFLSVYNALGFSGADVNNEITTLGATTITAYIDAEGRVYNYKVTSPFSTKFIATSGADEAVGMKMSGTTTLSYKFSF